MDGEKLLIHTLAEQQYQFHLLVKLLKSKGVIQDGEMERLYSPAEFAEFESDYRSHLISNREQK